MKNSNKIKLISTIVFVPLLIIGSFIVLHFIDRSNNMTKVHTEVQEWGKFAGINIKIKTEEANDYSTSISTPTTSNDYINEYIKNWLDEQEREFFAQLKGFSGNFHEDMMAHLNIQLDIDEINEHIYNLIFTTYTYLGGANGENKTKVFTVDLESDQIFELVDIINLQDEKKLKTFKKIVSKIVADDETLIATVDIESLENFLLQHEQLEWSLHKNVFRLYFNEYAIAPGSEGVIKLDIPLEKLTKLVNINIVEQFELSVIEDQIEQERQQAKAKEKQKKEEQEKQTKEKNKAKKKPNKNKDVKSDGKYVALTFDDGPSGTVTPEILHILQEFDVVATFFMLGSQVDYYPDLAAEVAEQGHEIANHTQNHVDLTTVKQSVAQQEIVSSREKIEKATGQTPRFIRPPYGAYNDTTLNIISKNDESIVLWSVDPRDWKNRNPKEISRNVIQAVKPGSIVLLHDIHQTTAEALPKILEELQKDGYTFVTVSQLIDLEDMATMKVIRGH